MDGFVVAGWMCFLAGEDRPDAEEGAERAAVEAVLVRHPAISQTGTLSYNNARLFMSVARFKERETDYLDLLAAFVADVQSQGLVVHGVASVRRPDDLSGVFETMALGQTRITQV